MTHQIRLSIAAGLTLALTLAVAGILIPAGAWSPALAISVLVLALQLGGVFYLPSRLSRTKPDAALASIGPLAVLIPLCIVLACAAVWAGLTLHEKISWTFSLLSAGAMVLGLVLLGAAQAKVIEASRPADDPRAQWQTLLATLSAQLPSGETHARLQSLAETIRYSARNVAGREPEEDAQISRILSSLANNHGETAKMLTQLDQIESALSIRESKLKALRSQI